MALDLLLALTCTTYKLLQQGYRAEKILDTVQVYCSHMAFTVTEHGNRDTTADKAFIFKQANPKEILSFDLIVVQCLRVLYF